MECECSPALAALFGAGALGLGLIIGNILARIIIKRAAQDAVKRSLW